MSRHYRLDEGTQKWRRWIPEPGTPDPEPEPSRQVEFNPHPRQPGGAYQDDWTQLDLFNPPARPVEARPTDPPSSHAAVKSIARSTLRERILIHLTNNPGHWFTDDDLIHLHHARQRNIVAKARGILESAGYVERSPDRMLPGDRITYRASELGLDWRKVSRR